MLIPQLLAQSLAQNTRRMYLFSERINDHN